MWTCSLARANSYWTLDHHGIGLWNDSTSTYMWGDYVVADENTCVRCRLAGFFWHTPFPPCIRGMGQGEVKQAAFCYHHPSFRTEGWSKQGASTMNPVWLCPSCDCFIRCSVSRSWDTNEPWTNKDARANLKGMAMPVLPVYCSRNAEEGNAVPTATGDMWLCTFEGFAEIMPVARQTFTQNPDRVRFPCLESCFLVCCANSRLECTLRRKSLDFPHTSHFSFLPRGKVHVTLKNLHTNFTRQLNWANCFC